MDSVTFRSANHASAITFCQREPDDRDQELLYFTIRLTDANLDAVARVYGYMCAGLTDAFDQVAAQWQRFTGPLEWSSLECEFSIALSHDGLGHFTLCNELSSSLYCGGWNVTNYVIVETGQLERMAADLRSFVGRCV